MKVLKTTTSKRETSVDLDLFEGRYLPRAVKRRIQEEVGNFLVEQTLVAMNEEKSPVQGEGSFQPLSKEYKKKKLAEVGSGRPNLEFEGVLKDELDFKATSEGVRIGVFGERAGAADGHCNLSGKSRLPKRRFLPDEGQNYKPALQREVERIVADVIVQETRIDLQLFFNVQTKRDLYQALELTLGPMSRSELRLAVFRNEELQGVLERYGLMELL